VCLAKTGITALDLQHFQVCFFSDSFENLNEVIRSKNKRVASAFFVASVTVNELKM